MLPIVPTPMPLTDCTSQAKQTIKKGVLHHMTPTNQAYSQDMGVSDN